MNVKLPHVNKKPLARKKFASNKNLAYNELWMEWKNHLQKNSDRKNWKNSKNEKTVKLPHVNKKPLARKRIFVQTPFFFTSLYKIRVKRFHAPKPLAFSLRFLFRHDKNHSSNLTS